MDLANLSVNEATTVAYFMGQEAKITYRPMEVTPKRLEQVNSGNDEEFYQFFADVVSAWDVKKGPKKVPLTQEGLGDVPMALLRAVFNAIMSDTGQEEAGKGSSGS